jgi:hypothetical protein
MGLMGVTVHFEGKLKSENAFAALLQRVQQLAKAQTWLTEIFECGEVTLLRVRNETEWDYKGPTKGIVLYIHEDCDPLRLEFDQDLYIQEFVKTQFAGVRTHVQLIALLREFQVFFAEIKVEDEGEYWETRDEAVLAEHIRRCDEMISEEARKNPSAQVKVRTPDGRLMDILE